MPLPHGKTIRRIAINTGGGDAPGLNAVIRAVTLAATNRGWEVLGIRRGYNALLEGEPCVKLTADSVRGIGHLGGTILGTTNKGNPFETWVETAGAKRLAAEVILENLKRLEVDGLIAVGGDGSLAIAWKLMQMGLPVIGVPKTIDNDLNATEVTFGFDTAVETATYCLDRLHSTAEAHDRVMVVEVMGRTAGWIALYAGIATAAHVILMPEIKYDLQKVANFLLERKRIGRPNGIVVVSEGAMEAGRTRIYKAPSEPGRERRLGGAGEYVAERLEQLAGMETRSLVLGHIQRGGSPSNYDRALAYRYGAAAVRLAEAGHWGRMVSFRPPRITSVPLAEAVQERKLVPLDCDEVRTARELGICLGD